MPKFVVLMTARSWSGKSQPSGRPEKTEFVPLMYSVQSPLLSSIQRPAEFFFTMSPTRGGWFVTAMTGEKFVPLLGGGFSPAYGPSKKSTGVGGGKPRFTPAAMMVEALPDSKIAT